MKKKEDMLVQAIKNGTVIDRIPASQSLVVVKLLNLDADDGSSVAIAMRMQSEKIKVKDIIKIQGRTLTKSELNALGIITPGVTVSFIKNYEVAEKFIVQVPKSFDGIIKCNNPTCATNHGEPIVAKFSVLQEKPLLVRCKYCDRVMLEQNVLSQF